MIALVAAIAVTAVVVAAITVRVTQRVTGSAIEQGLGLPPGADVVTEHRRIVEQAHTQIAEADAQKDRLQLSLDALASGVVVTDSDGQVLVTNRVAAAMTDRPHEQALIDAAVTELVTSALEGDRVEQELEVFGPPPRALLMHAAPITAEAQMIGALAVIEDVTEHRRIDETRRDFVANLSHELRTPVGAVSLLAEMLVDEPDGGTRAQLTSRMLIETERMTETIDGLLELSRIESSTETYDDVIVVQHLLDEAVQRTRVIAESAGVELGALAPSDPITVIGNRSQLATALVNLVENAIKYSSPADSVSLRARLDDEGVALVVQDTGRGIPARDLDRIFERFYRVDRSRDAATGGSGIGLSIVRHVALNHGGQVKVESFEGDGSTFTLVLPAARTGDGSDIAPPARETTRGIGR